MSSKNADTKMGSFHAPRLLIFIGALAQIHVNFVGLIFLSEIILFIIWIFGRNRKKMNFENLLTKNNQKINIFKKLLIYSFFFQIITDLIIGINFIDVLKGSALILVTVLNLQTITKLSNRYYGAIQQLLIGYALSYFVSAFIQPNGYYKSYPWKFGFAYGTSLLLVIILSTYLKNRKFFATLIIMIFGVVNLALDTRSLGLVFLITGLCFLIFQLKNKSKVALVLFAIIILMLVPIFFASYISKALEGFLGVNVRDKYISQSHNTRNIFFGGRTDVFVGISQIQKHPLWGQGSYAKISMKNREEIQKELVSINPNLYPLINYYEVGELIPIHSIIFQFWVWYGILGALPWLWYFFTIVSTVIGAFKGVSCISLLNVYLITLTTWDLFFSPYGADRRFALPLFFIAIVLNNGKVKV